MTPPPPPPPPPPHILKISLQSLPHLLIGWFIWLAGRLTSPFSTKIGYTANMGGDLVMQRLKMADDTVTSRLHCLFVQRRPKMGKDKGGSFKLLMLTPTKGWNHHKTYLSVHAVEKEHSDAQYCSWSWKSKSNITIRYSQTSYIQTLLYITIQHTTEWLSNVSGCTATSQM